jgi:hypothetical protein
LATVVAASGTASGVSTTANAGENRDSPYLPQKRSQISFAATGQFLCAVIIHYFKEIEMMKKVLFGLSAVMMVFAGCDALSSEADKEPHEPRHEGDFWYTVGSGKATISEYTDSAAVVTIPAVIDSQSVAAIGVFAFQDDQLTSVTIGANVTLETGTLLGYFESAYYNKAAGTQIMNKHNLCNQDRKSVV